MGSTNCRHGIIRLTGDPEPFKSPFAAVDSRSRCPPVLAVLTKATLLTRRIRAAAFECTLKRATNSLLLRRRASALSAVQEEPRASMTAIVAVELVIPSAFSLIPIHTNQNDILWDRVVPYDGKDIRGPLCIPIISIFLLKILYFLILHINGKWISYNYLQYISLFTYSWLITIISLQNYPFFNFENKISTM